MKKITGITITFLDGKPPFRSVSVYRGIGTGGHAYCPSTASIWRCQRAQLKLMEPKAKPEYLQEKCKVCGCAFTIVDWFNHRHIDDLGNYYHDKCCPFCKVGN